MKSSCAIVFIFFISLHLWCVWFHPLEYMLSHFSANQFWLFLFSQSHVIHIQLTSDNSNPRQLEPKSISPGFPSYIYSRKNDLAHSLLIYCNFTLGNSNLPLTRSIFFPFRSFLHNFTLDNSMLKAREKSGEKPCTEVRNIEYISKQPSQFFVFTFCHSSSNSVFIPVYFVA